MARVRRNVGGGTLSRRGRETLTWAPGKSPDDLIENLKTADGRFAKEFRALMRITAEDYILPRIEAKIPTRKNRRAPKLKRTLRVQARLEGVRVMLGRPNIWWASIIEEGSKPHQLGPGGGQHPGFAGAHMMKRGIEEAAPQWERLYDNKMDEFIDWLAKGGEGTLASHRLKGRSAARTALRRSETKARRAKFG